MIHKVEITNWFKKLQDDICHQLEVLDGESTFIEDKWLRPEGGGGRSRAIKDGAIIEKGGVNFSAVEGSMPAHVLKVLHVDVDKEQSLQFYATGVSIVLHPRSPMTPIIHMNVRYFELSNGIWWFGGGIDLTPHYVNDALASDFHSHLKKVCDSCDPTYYNKFKNWADDYFFISHRNETRGIGGIFFDRLNATSGLAKNELWTFVQNVGESFVPLYSHQVQQTQELPYGENEKKWQLLRRGRYVEFNLVLDRGTKFGLQTNGRTESILMSMPPHADWEYAHQVDEDSREKDTLFKLRKGIDWIK